MVAPRFNALNRLGRRVRLGLLGTVAVLLLGAAPVFAADAARKAELTDAASADLGKIRTMVGEKKFENAMGAIDALIAKSPKDSYDYAFANRTKVQVLYQLESTNAQPDFTKMIPVLEETLRMGYFDSDLKFAQEMTMFLVQLYFMQAGGTKDEAAQKAWMAKAETALGKWFKLAPQPPETPGERYAEAIQTNANILFQLGKTKEALAEIDRAMRYLIKPKDQMLVLKFVCQQMLGDLESAADTLELLVQINPKNKNYWSQLYAFYLADKKDERGAFLRAIVTQRRAIENGAMSSPKEYMSLFGLYYNLAEYGRAAESLTEWLDTGKVENTEENWELLSYCYQLLRREDSVVKVLEKGSSKFSTGNLSFSLASYYWYDGKYEKAIDAGLKAWEKGKLKNTARAAMFLAQAFNEVRPRDPDYVETRKWAEEAKKFPENQKEADRILRYIDELQGRNKPAEKPAKKS